MLLLGVPHGGITGIPWDVAYGAPWRYTPGIPLSHGYHGPKPGTVGGPI